jgi:hypothetical protein
MAGLLRSTGRRFGEQVEVRAVQRRDEGHPHDLFLVLRTALGAEPGAALHTGAA